MATKQISGYNEALRRIALARARKDTELSLAALDLVRLPDEIGTLTALRNLDLSWCEQLQNLQPLAALTALQSLDLIGCGQLQDLQPLAGLAALTSINLIGGALVDCSPGARRPAPDHLPVGEICRR